jgi:hypothetical protein
MLAYTFHSPSFANSFNDKVRVFYPASASF